VAKKGDVLAHHFAHAAETACSGETALHKLAKQILADHRKIRVPEQMFYVPGKYVSVAPATTRAGLVEIEPSFPGFRPDAVLTDDGRVAIEFLVTHPVPDEKIDLIRKHNMDCVEVFLSAMRKETDLSVVTDFVLYSAPRKWINCEALKQAEIDYRLKVQKARLYAQQLAEAEAAQHEAEREEYNRQVRARLAAIREAEVALPAASPGPVSDAAVRRLAGYFGGPDHMDAARKRLAGVAPYAAGLLVGAWTHGVGRP
jgi:hypothetical protein